MVIIISGPQASGKGTQAKLIAQDLGLFHMELGKMFRSLAKDNNKLQEILDSGALGPTEDTVSYMDSYLKKKNVNLNNVIFDGFPRSLEQYNYLKNWLKKRDIKIDGVVYLQISDEEAIKRLSARRIDPETGDIYNLLTKPPGPDINISNLVQRQDDKPKAIKKRLSIFHDLTEPMLKRAEKEGLLFEIDGERPIEEIHQDILNRLKILDEEK
jgi:adenylate kinase